MRLIEIKTTKAILFLTELELIKLLSRDPELWQKAIRRGKHFRRAAATEGRERVDETREKAVKKLAPV